MTPDRRLEVSGRTREEYENGRDYYALAGSRVRVPERPEDRPAIEHLRWHNENRYLG